jgi:hypothetical protein
MPLIVPLLERRRRILSRSCRLEIAHVVFKWVSDLRTTAVMQDGDAGLFTVWVIVDRFPAIRVPGLAQGHRYGKPDCNLYPM